MVGARCWQHPGYGFESYIGHILYYYIRTMSCLESKHLLNDHITTIYSGQLGPSQERSHILTARRGSVELCWEELLLGRKVYQHLRLRRRHRQSNENTIISIFSLKQSLMHQTEENTLKQGGTTTICPNKKHSFLLSLLKGFTLKIYDMT